MRTRLVQNRTATVNPIRSLAAEYGVTFPIGRVKLNARLKDVLEDDTNRLSFVLWGIITIRPGHIRTTVE